MKPGTSGSPTQLELRRELPRFHRSHPNQAADPGLLLRGAGRSPALLGTAAAIQTAAADSGIPALLRTQEGPPALTGSEMPAPCCLASPCCLCPLRSQSKVRVEQGTMKGSGRQTDSWTEGGGSWVRPHLQARDDRKAGGQVASLAEGWEWEIVKPFLGCPWQLMDQLRTLPTL